MWVLDRSCPPAKWPIEFFLCLRQSSGHSNPLVYAALILAGILAIGILPPLLMDRLRKPGWKATGDRSASQL